MNKNFISVIAICAAVVSAAVAACVVSVNRSSTARARAEAAASEEMTAAANRKAREAEATAEADRRRSKEAEAKAASDNLAAEKLAVERRKEEAKIAENNRIEREKAAETARDEAKKAQADREAEKEKRIAAGEERARAESLEKAQQAKALEAAAKAEIAKQNADKKRAEENLVNLRKIDFEAWQQALIALKIDLDERERALMPEKTIADLEWAGGNEDTVFDETGNVVKQAKVPYDPEKDAGLPLGERSLFREQRLVRTSLTNHVAAVRANVVAPLEKLYVEAIRENRVIDADFYRKTLKSLYPDWEFKVEK